MQKLFNLLLLIIFVILVSLFAYKTLKTPEVSRISVTSSVSADEDAKTRDTNGCNLNEEEFDKKIHDYILNHPEVLVESIESLQRRRTEDSNNQVANYLSENKSNIESEGTPPIFGNKDGDIAIVVFYDYNCSFCKHANEITNEILESDHGVKVILRPLPILGGTSMYATKIALAVQKISEEKFPIIHNEMMKMKPITEEGVKVLLDSHGIDYKIVDNELNSLSIKQLVAKNFDLARNLGIKGAPSYVINGILIPGLIDKERFTAIIGELRQIAAQAKSAEPGSSKELNNSEDSNGEGNPSNQKQK